MRKNIFTMFLMLAVCIFLSGEAFSAWTQAKGHSYNQLTLSYYKTTKKFTTIERNASDEIVNTHSRVFRNEEEEFTSSKVTYYGEYGIIDTLTVYGSVPYDRQRSNDTMKFAGEDGPNGIGDINLGLRYNLVQNLLGSGALMSLQGEVKIPEAYHYGHPLEDLSLGDGQYDATLAILLGRGFGKGYAWLNTGYKYRFENEKFDPVTFKPSDQLKVSFGGGYPLTSWLSAVAYVAWTKALGNAEVSNELITKSFETGTAANNHAEGALIQDTLALESSSLNAYAGLQFNITPKWQTVVSYNRDLSGVGEFKTKNSALGETFGLAVVYVH
ncbi:MAG: hypothetical protein C4560_00875 [Nitrospiraceae bacterium]|nr:MAG: hypothetical protein C4560_00875 [Nitrospiraceae bacterium]